MEDGLPLSTWLLIAASVFPALLLLGRFLWARKGGDL